MIIYQVKDQEWRKFNQYGKKIRMLKEIVSSNKYGSTWLDALSNFLYKFGVTKLCMNTNCDSYAKVPQIVEFKKSDNQSLEETKVELCFHCLERLLINDTANRFIYAAHATITRLTPLSYIEQDINYQIEQAERTPSSSGGRTQVDPMEHSDSKGEDIDEFDRTATKILETSKGIETVEPTSNQPEDDDAARTENSVSQNATEKTSRTSTPEQQTPSSHSSRRSERIKNLSTIAHSQPNTEQNTGNLRSNSNNKKIAQSQPDTEQNARNLRSKDNNKNKPRKDRP